MVKWRGLQPAGFRPRKDQTPQAEARATGTESRFKVLRNLNDGNAVVLR